MSTATASDIVIRQPSREDDHIVHAFFYALHAFNAELDRRFELAENWRSVLEEHLNHERTHGHGTVLLAFADDRPAGLLMMDGHTDSPLFRHRTWAEIVALYVEPTFRGRNVADDLIREGLAWAHANGYDRIQLYVTASNFRAKGFYGRSGFFPIQEIWCRDLEVATGQPAVDIACETAYAHGHHLLSSNRHHLTIDDEPCREDESTLHQ